MPSGRFMQIEGVPRAINWSLNDSKTSVTSSGSNTRGGTERGGGIRKWGGAFGARGGKPTHMPNLLFNFDGYTLPDNGTEGGDGLAYQGPAIIAQTTVNWSWANNERISWGSNYNGRTGLNILNATPVLDNAASVDDFACGTFFEYSPDDGGTWHEIPRLVSATLTITAQLTAESNSSTRAGGICYESWEPGNIDWTLSANQQDHRRGVDGYPDLGDDVILRLRTNATDFWVLKYAKQEAYSGLTLDRNSNTPVARTINMAMQSNNPGLGHIILPGETVPWWGEP